MSKFALITAALLFIPSSALAQIVFDDGSPAQPAKKTDVDKVVCRSVETIGSRLQNHQVCMTKDQWRTYEQAYKDQVAEIQARTQAPSSK